jgi:hypothetical protein
MDREVAQARGKVNAEELFAGREGYVLAYSGHVREGKAKAQHAADLARQTSQPERAALWHAGAALRDALVGDAAAARRGAAAALELSTDRDPEYGSAVALALSGDSSKAHTLASDLERRFPEDSAVKFGYLPGIRALIALNQGQPAQAIEYLKTGASYDLGMPLCAAPAFLGVFYPVYVRGLGYLAAHQGTEAAAEFQKILDHRSIVVSDTVGALARLQLGRALVLAGDAARARSAYEDFLALWKDADAGIPILAQARAEYARLR